MQQQKTPSENQKTIDSFDYLQNAASVNDCTGLIPSLPTSEEELESYLDVYEYLPPHHPAQSNSDFSDFLATDRKKK